MDTYRQLAWVNWGNCIIGGLMMIASGGAACAADYNTVIDKAIAEWKEKEPTWTYPGNVPSHTKPGPGQSHFFLLDQRTRIYYGRPIAKALAAACGKEGIETLQKRLRDAPPLIMLALDELGASNAVAEDVVTLVQDWPNRYQDGAYDWRIAPCMLASACSLATRHATALALVKMPVIADVPPCMSFVAVAGDKDVLTALETAAKDPERAPKDVKHVDWRPYYLTAASKIRKREALPPKVREVREKDDLLFWQADVDQIGYRGAFGNYEHSAQTLVNQHERISTSYLIERLLGPEEKVSHDNRERERQPPNSPSMPVGTGGLVFSILAKQGDRVAIPALQEFGKKHPSLAADAQHTIEAIQGADEAGHADETGAPRVPSNRAQPDARPTEDRGKKAR